MAAIEGLKRLSLQVEAAHQHRVFSIASHDALAPRLHGAVVTVLLFQHLIVALLQVDEIRGLNGLAEVGMECCARKA